MDACFVANTMFCSLVKSNKLLSKTKKKEINEAHPTHSLKGSSPPAPQQWKISVCLGENCYFAG
jgi:hypothetical protein